MSRMGLLDGKNPLSERRLRKPKRNLHFEDPLTASFISKIAPLFLPKMAGCSFASLAGDHQNDAPPMRCGRQQIADQLVMGFGLAEPMKIYLAVDLYLAAADFLSRTSIQMMKLRGRWRGSIRRRCQSGSWPRNRLHRSERLCGIGFGLRGKAGEVKRLCAAHGEAPKSLFFWGETARHFVAALFSRAISSKA